MSKIFKCSTKRREMCVNMEKFSSDQYGSGRRIFVGQSVSLDTGHAKGVRAWYHYGSKRNEFVIMLFCPWCGGRLGWNSPKARTAIAETLKGGG